MVFACPSSPKPASVTAGELRSACSRSLCFMKGFLPYFTSGSFFFFFLLFKTKLIREEQDLGSSVSCSSVSRGWIIVCLIRCELWSKHFLRLGPFRELSPVCLFQHLTGSLSCSYSPATIKGSNSAFCLYPAAYSHQTEPTLNAFGAFFCPSWLKWTHGFQKLLLEGAEWHTGIVWFLMNDWKNESGAEIKPGVPHPRGMLVRKAPTWSTAWRKRVKEFQL